MRNHRAGCTFAHVLLTCLLISGCASFQSTLAHLEATGAISPADEGAAKPAPTALASANPRSDPETTSRIAALPASPAPRTSCDRGKAIAVGMTAREVYASCWGKPKSVNSS